jgi:hypothetical protein
MTATDDEHQKTKEIFENLFQALNKDLDADMELYVQPTKNPKGWGSVLYGLGSMENYRKYNT